MKEVQSSLDIRCFCSRSPLLAKWGRTSDDRTFVHIKVYKQKRLYAEVVVESGNKIRVRCRNCFRWTTINVKKKPEAEVTELPENIPTSISG